MPKRALGPFWDAFACAMMRDEYAALKREVYARHSADIIAYNDGKNSWIKAVEAVALAWYRQA
jgi:GrpB-like predicted nucleotidyltransferase (UPF0157 family)